MAETVPFQHGKPSVAMQSNERRLMQADLDLISDVREGLPAMQRKRSTYLPKYAAESFVEHDRRTAAAPWRPEFADALSTLAAKPFAKPVTLGENASDKVKAFAEDVDGRGNNLHTFAKEVLTEAIANGVHGIMVYYPFGSFRTLAEEKLAKPRPYWAQINIHDVIACYTDYVDGREIITHLRLRNFELVRDGFDENWIKQVLVYEPGRFERWQELPNAKDEYEIIESGEIHIGGVPTSEVHATFLFTGKRSGMIRVKPPLRDLADVQIELYRSLSRQEEILTYAGSPMLGTSLAAPTPSRKSDEPLTMPVGPKVVLFGAGTTDGRGGPPWAYVQPAADNIREVREQVDSVIEDARYLGMQPTVARSGDVTATAASVNAAKAHSVLESWALGLKDRLEQAFVFTALWMSESTAAEVFVHTDFGVGMQGNEEAKTLLEGQKNGVISKKTLRAEWQRRGLLGDAFDPDDEDLQIATEQEGLEPEDDIDPANGDVIDLNRRRA